MIMKADELKATMKESPGRYADPLASEVNDKDKFWNTPELERSMVVDNFTDNNEDDKFRKSFAPCTVPSEFFEDTNFYTDKNVMECELPELIVCYKESAYHVVKDICIDEGIPSEDKILINNDNEKMDINLPIPDDHNDHSDMSKLSIDTEIPIQDGLKLSSGKDCEDAVAKECGTKEKVDIDLVDLDEIKHVSKDDSDDAAACESGPDGLESNTVQDTVNNCGPIDLLKTDEKNSNATNDLMNDASVEQLVSTSSISVQDNRPQTSLKFLLESDNGLDDAEHQLGQMSIEEISKGPAVVSEAEELSRNCQTNNVSYDSNVESETITFNFDSSEVATSAGHVQDLPVQSQDVPVPSHDDKTSESFSTTSQVQQRGEGDTSPEHVHDLPIPSKNVPSHDDKTSESFSMASQVQRGEGESSFSSTGPVSGLITYSGPITFSGSISLRSDSSTTSTRSFAFPILQSEWNSSPVRMAKADRRRFRKHRGWRHGLLCCRF